MFNDSKICVHFIGICGAGMSVLAKYFYDLGMEITGSDINYTKDKLNFNYKKIYNSHNKSNVLRADIVIYSSAVSEDNIELKTAKKLNIPVYSRGQILGQIFNSYNYSIGVAGTHGKTTATCMFSHVLNSANLAFTSFIGGEDETFSNYVNNYLKEIFVAEVCEYQNNIKNVSPSISVVLNIDNDHLDTYKSVYNVKNSFFKYLDRGKYKVICLDDPFLKGYKGENVITYAIESDADYKAFDIKSNKGKYSFSCKLKDGKIIKVNLNVYGEHNIYNALSVIAVCDRIFCIESEAIKRGLEDFKGVKRRFEYLGIYKNYNLIADYCHHPKEIKSTLKTIKEIYGNDYQIIFQPHTYSRTKLLFNDFIDVFKNENIILYKEYSAREKYDYNGSAEKMANHLKCSYIENVKKLKNAINIEKYSKNLILLGAGDLYENFKNLIK